MSQMQAIHYTVPQLNAPNIYVDYPFQNVTKLWKRNLGTLVENAMLCGHLLFSNMPKCVGF